MPGIALHISFYHIAGRYKYLNRIIEEVCNYPFITDVFIHTNISFSKDTICANTNGTLEIIVHDLTNVHPHKLTWKCRELMKSQREVYDIFMYIEDDILVPKDALQYWLSYKNLVSKYQYNLGFLRIEVDTHGREYMTDVTKPLTHVVELDTTKFVQNIINPYCAFWIYDSQEFHRFTESPLYNIELIEGYGIREKSAIGLHGNLTPWYKGTLIPIENKQLNLSCRIYHMPNNYVIDKTNRYATILFKNGISSSVKL